MSACSSCSRASVPGLDCWSGTAWPLGKRRTPSSHEAGLLLTAVVGNQPGGFAAARQQTHAKALPEAAEDAVEAEVIVHDAQGLCHALLHGGRGEGPRYPEQYR